MENNSKQTAQHTPGPWKILQGRIKDDFIVVEKTGNTVAEPNAALFNDPAQFDPRIRSIGLEEAKANARLIAAAPELLAELVGARAWIANTMTPGDFLQEQALAKIDATIAKARGNQ